MDARVRFGVAGWSYADWEGIVYPSGLKAAEQLPYLARFVDVIEINSSFYRVPSTKIVEGWLRKTSALPSFSFTAKLPQDVTHNHKVDSAAARAFHEAFQPLVEAGRLRQLLAQFRYDFADSPIHRGLLREICCQYSGTVPLVVEVRHNSWQGGHALDFLASLGVTVANLDMPLARDSFSLVECRVGSHGYLRLHGRNRKAWFDRNAGRDETYNYLYSPEELERIKARILALRDHFKSITVVANNHYRGKEVANALELKSLVSGDKVEVPAGLLAEYPRLAAVAAVA